MWVWWPHGWRTAPRGQSFWGVPECTQSAKQLAGGSFFLRRSPEVCYESRGQLIMAVAGCLAGLLTTFLLLPCHADLCMAKLLESGERPIS